MYEVNYCLYIFNNVYVMFQKFKNSFLKKSSEFLRVKDASKLTIKDWNSFRILQLNLDIFFSKMLPTEIIFLQIKQSFIKGLRKT